jgi:uncharacterized protein YgiB involved in biofilm formation
VQRQKRSLKVTLGSLAAIGALTLLTAASCEDEEDEEEYSQVCVDEKTNLRVEDDECDDDDSRTRGFMWFFINSRLHATPAIGSAINPTHGSYVRPTTGKISTVSRGGFGARGSTSGS